jgi:hypothetical protein
VQVLQSAPGLQRFVMDVLGRLIARQFWADKNLWQGFLLLADKAGGLHCAAGWLAGWPDCGHC